MPVLHYDAHQTRGLVEEVYENEDYRRYGITYRDGDCVVDVGANIGLFSLFAHQQCRLGALYAFEPIPPTNALARRNFELYGLDVKLFAYGLSDRDETATFTHYPQMSGLSSRFGDVRQDVAEATSMFHHYLRAAATGRTPCRRPPTSTDCSRSGIAPRRSGARCGRSPASSTSTDSNASIC